MKRAFALLSVSMLSVACGGEAAPAKSASDAPVADSAAAPATEPTPAPEAGNDEQSAAAAAEEAWAGEGEAKAEKPTEAPGKAETRTMEVIAQVVKENRKPVRECFDKAKKELPDLKGDMVIHFVVDPAGKVRKAELNQERSTLKSPAVVECAVKVVLGIKFPPSSRGMDTTVNYPFNLN
jgi:hypothetical protein